MSAPEFNQPRIDWQSLAQELGSLGADGESGGSDLARRALELIIGVGNVRAAVDHYIAGDQGYELARSVLSLLQPWSAMERCLDIYRSTADVETRRSAVELLRVVADARGLEWVPEFLNDPDEGVQCWGAGLMDQLLWSRRVDPEQCGTILEAMEKHANAQVRELVAFIRSYLAARSAGAND